MLGERGGNFAAEGRQLVYVWVLADPQLPVLCTRQASRSKDRPVTSQGIFARAAPAHEFKAPARVAADVDSRTLDADDTVAAARASATTCSMQIEVWLRRNYISQH